MHILKNKIVLGSGSVDPHFFADPDPDPESQNNADPADPDPESQNNTDPADPDPKHCLQPSLLSTIDHPSTTHQSSFNHPSIIRQLSFNHPSIISLKKILHTGLRLEVIGFPSSFVSICPSAVCSTPPSPEHIKY